MKSKMKSIMKSKMKSKMKRKIINKSLKQNIQKGIDKYSMDMLTKKFKIVLRDKIDNSEQFYKMQKKHEYFNLFNELYKIYILNDNKKSKISTKSNNLNQNEFNIMEKIFPFFANLNKHCIGDKNKKYINLYDEKLEKQYKSFLYLEYDKINIYKTMDGFYDIKSENEFIKKNRNIPFWFSSSYYAFKVVNSRNGGITAYCLKNNENLKIFVINCKNILNLINFIKMVLPDKIKIKNKFVSKKYLLDLVRLSSCSEFGLNNQMQIYSKFNNYDDEIWLTSKPQTDSNSLCNIKTVKNDYFGIVKNKGFHNYNFAYLLQYINKTYFNNNFDGYIVKHKYTPYFFTGVTLEEIILFDPYSKLKRNINDEYDWYNYKNKLDFSINENLKLHHLLSEYNNKFILNKLYNKLFNSEDNKNIIKIINKNINSISIIFLNCNNFKSININDTIKDNIIETNKLIEFMNCDIVILINANDFIINKNNNNNNDKYKIDKKINFSAVYKYESIINENIKKIIDNIDIINIKPKIENPYLRPDFDKFIDITNNNLNNFKNISKSTIKTAKILYVKDNYILSVSPEIDYIKNNDFNYINLKTSFTKTDNFLFIKDYKLIGSYLLDFNRSYYLPQLIIIKNV